MNERIRKLRKSLGLSGEKFGEKLGVKKNSVSQWENGKNNITEQIMKSICREFNVNEEWLRYGVGDMFNNPDDIVAECVGELLTSQNDIVYDAIKSILATYKTLDDSSKEVIRDFTSSVISNIKANKIK